MAATGGSVESITIAGREFPVTADADIQRILGGFMNDMQANGNGTARVIKTRQIPALNGIVVECDDSRNDQEFVQDVADGNDFVPTAVTYVSGDVYEMRAQVQGEVTYSNQAATLSFDMRGTGEMTQQG